MNPYTRRRIYLAGIGLLVVIATLTGVAYGDDSTAAVLGPFDVADSRGLRISQYQLSIDAGMIGTSKSIQALALTFTWDAYRMFIGFIAYVVDWAVGMSWVTWITGPINTAATAIHDNLLAALHMDRLGMAGLMGLLLTLAGTVSAVHLFRGRTGRGFAEVIVSASVAAATVGVLAAPVVWFAGTGTEPAAPLRVAQRVGLEVSNLILRGSMSDASIESTIAPGQKPVAETVQPVKTGSLLVDTFVRPVHQLVNYGSVIDTTDQKCVSAYDTALKAGPYDDDAKQARTAVGDCNHKLQDYAESAAWTRVLGLNLYVVTAGWLGVVVLVFVVLLAIAVLVVRLSFSLPVG